MKDKIVVTLIVLSMTLFVGAAIAVYFGENTLAIVLAGIAIVLMFVLEHDHFDEDTANDNDPHGDHYEPYQAAKEIDDYVSDRRVFPLFSHEDERHDSDPVIEKKRA